MRLWEGVRVGVVSQERQMAVTCCCCHMFVLCDVALQTYFRSHPDLLQQLLNVNPPMAQAVLSDGPHQLTRLMQDGERRRRQQQHDEQVSMRWDHSV